MKKKEKRPNIVNTKQDLEDQSRWEKDLIKKQKIRKLIEKKGDFYLIYDCPCNTEIFILDKDLSRKEKIFEDKRVQIKRSLLSKRVIK